MPKSVARWGDEHVEFAERAAVEQQIDPFARGELALLVLLLHPIGSAALHGLFAKILEALNLGINCGHEYPAEKNE
jgi:hypothetical protein